MSKVKCCYNCKYFKADYTYNAYRNAIEVERTCEVKRIDVWPDDKCDNHIPKDVLMEFEGGEKK